MLLTSSAWNSNRTALSLVCQGIAGDGVPAGHIDAVHVHRAPLQRQANGHGGTREAARKLRRALRAKASGLVTSGCGSPRRC